MTKKIKAKAEMEGMQKRLLIFIQFIVSLIRIWSSPHNLIWMLLSNDNGYPQNCLYSKQTPAN